MLLLFINGYVPLVRSIIDHIEVFSSSLSILGMVYNKLIALKLVTLGLIIFVLVVINGVCTVVSLVTSQHSCLMVIVPTSRNSNLIV
jgi:hypothetical protein